MAILITGGRLYFKDRVQSGTPVWTLNSSVVYYPHMHYIRRWYSAIFSGFLQRFMINSTGNDFENENLSECAHSDTYQCRGVCFLFTSRVFCPVRSLGTKDLACPSISLAKWSIQKRKYRYSLARSDHSSLDTPHLSLTAQFPMVRYAGVQAAFVSSGGVDHVLTVTCQSPSQFHGIVLIVTAHDVMVFALCILAECQ